VGWRVRLIPTGARQVLATMAHLIDESRAVDSSLGRVVLRPHQQRAASTALRLIAQTGGALLADPVGLGKTYSALAVAQQWGGATIVAPPGLRDMWTTSATRAGVSIHFHSLHALSRGVPPPEAPRLIIVDESHHLRNPSTIRYDTLSAACAGRPVLLLSATPIHNSPRDLQAQLALFLGSRAWGLAAHDLESMVLRHHGAELPLPSADAPVPLRTTDDTQLLEQILALPTAVAASDEGAAHALSTVGLVHLWGSSQAALSASLRRRRARGSALADALRTGRHPTSVQLRAWCHDGAAVQLAFPELVIPLPGDTPSAGLLPAIEAWGERASALCRRISGAADRARADRMRALVRTHAGQRIVAFSQYHQTIMMYWRALRSLPGVAVVTGRGAWMASGRVPASDILAELAPGAPPPDGRVAAVTLLLANDV
jgi:hypothetical protein